MTCTEKNCRRPTHEDRRKCLYHLFADVLKSRRYRRNNNDFWRARRRKEYYERKEEGQCTSCGKVLMPDSTTVKCTTCAEMDLYRKR